MIVTTEQHPSLKKAGDNPAFRSAFLPAFTLFLFHDYLRGSFLSPQSLKAAGCSSPVGPVTP